MRQWKDRKSAIAHLREQMAENYFDYNHTDLVELLMDCTSDEDVIENLKEDIAIESEQENMTDEEKERVQEMKEMLIMIEETQPPDVSPLDEPANFEPEE